MSATVVIEEKSTWRSTFLRFLKDYYVIPLRIRRERGHAFYLAVPSAGGIPQSANKTLATL